MNIRSFVHASYFYSYSYSAKEACQMHLKCLRNSNTSRITVSNKYDNKNQINQSINQSIPKLKSNLPKFKLNFQFCKSNAGQKCLSYFGPKIWNSLSSDSKSANSINSFKHKMKDNFFQNIQRGKRHICVLLKLPKRQSLTTHG